jgi:hypothetical protein
MERGPNMGMFSWDCEGCGHPLLSPFVLENKNGWMADVVALLNNGALIIGEYDGYGRVKNTDILDNAPMVYHHACWKLMGEPRKHVAESEPSADQGCFFDDNVHNHPQPKNKKDMETIRT